MAMTLTELNRLISRSIAEVPELRDVWVVAELSNVSGGKGTHWYMDLLEKDASGNNLARMKGMIWAQHSRAVNLKLYQATGVYFRDGIKVMVRGQVSFHPSFGMGFSIIDVEPSFTVGDMERIRREILEALRREGIIDRNKTLPIPTAPQRVAVISSEGAAGYGDFVHQLGDTPEGFVFYTKLFPARMQGKETAASVIAALDRIEATRDFWDVAVIIRGGGASSDLNGFDNLELARRVALSPIPIVVGIGHERDRTVLDEIAAVRCKTPTAVAAWLVDNLREALGRATEMTQMIVRLVQDRLTGDRRRLDNAASMVPVLAMKRLQSARADLSRITMRLPEAAARATSEARMKLDRIRLSAEAAAEKRIALGRGQLESLERLVAVLDPAATLKRGYSITRVNGHAVRNAADIPQGTEIETTLAEGKVKSTVL